MIGKSLVRILLGSWLVGGLLAPSALAGVALPLLGDTYDFNGTRVDISGDTILVGGCRGGSGEKGWAQVFVHNDTSGQWLWQQTLESADPTLTAASRFGYGVGLDGDTAVVGAYGSNKAYVFARAADTWTEDAVPLTHTGANWFGYDTRIDDDYILIGAPSSTSAYAFGEGMTAGQSLSASGTQAFGTSVAISDTAALVGDPEANTAYFYRYHYDPETEESSWDQEAAISRGSGYDEFGASVAIDGDYAIVGADGTNLEAGSATIYHRSGDTWIEQTTLAPTELVSGDSFGASVAISGNVAVVGAVNQGPLGARSGSAYVFERAGNSWLPLGKLRPNDGAAGDKFGNAVAIDGDWIVVGAWYHDAYTGAAYVFEVPSSTLIPGDATLNEAVDDADAAILAEHWGTASGMEWTNGDFNGDGAVNAADAAILAAHWHVGVTESSTTVPEPTTATLLAGLFFLLLNAKTRRRKDANIFYNSSSLRPCVFASLR